MTDGVMLRLLAMVMKLFKNPIMVKTKREMCQDSCEDMPGPCNCSANIE